jgi:hypothetical protein
MLNSLLVRLTFATILILGIYGCKKDSDPAPVPDIDNKVPIAHAGLHHELTLPIDTVNLTGTGMDSDGVISAYLWSQVSGPMESIIENQGAPTTNVKFSKSGSYLFQLMVVDNGGATGLDTVSVLVKPSPLDSVTLGSNAQDGYLDLTFAGNGSGADYTDPNSPEIDASAWTAFGGPDILRAALFFNLAKLPANITIQSAQLSLYSNPTPLNGNLVDANYGTNNAIFIERVTSSWDMSSGYNTKPTTTTVNNILIPHTNLPRLDLIDVDVTNLVKDMIANTNYGFGIRLQSEVQYTSRLFCGIRYADTSKHPHLKIVYNFN